MAPIHGRPIRFGTDGWRGIIADDFTFDNVGVVSLAYGDWLARQTGSRPGRILVGYDTRFQSDRFARHGAAVLAARGHQVHITPGPVPTPAVSWAVKHHGFDGALMVTASHNPAIYNGIKIKARYGGPALPPLTEAVEQQLAANVAAGRVPSLPADAVAADSFDLPVLDPLPGYMSQLESVIDLERIAAFKPAAAVDSMHGSAAGLLRTVLEGHGIPVTEVRSEPDPLFGGVHPEPLARHLGPLLELVDGVAASVGLATDGDGDRIGAADPVTGFVDPQQIFALLLQHLAEVRGWTGMVVKTYAGTRMVDRLASEYGLPFRETPIGFKHVCELALEHPVLMGGEESGGIGVIRHLMERDGLLCGLLLLEIMAVRGRTLGEQMRRIMEQVGPHHFRRIDLKLVPGQLSVVENLKVSPPSSIGGLPVTEVETMDGVKFRLGEAGWILFRASGTEPLLRVYAELDTPGRLEDTLRAAQELASRGGCP